MVATNCLPIVTQLTDFGVPQIGGDIQVSNLAWGYGPRRRQLDQVLVQSAIEAGAEFRPHFTVESLLGDGDRVEGIRGRDTRRRINITEKAGITIDADGRNSLLARAVRSPSYEEARGEFLIKMASNTPRTQRFDSL